MPNHTKASFTQTPLPSDHGTNETCVYHKGQATDLEFTAEKLNWSYAFAVFLSRTVDVLDGSTGDEES